MRGTATHRTADPTIYPEEERVGEDMLQRWIVELLRPLLQWWLAKRGVTAFVGADQFIYWRQHDPHARVAPDIYVLPSVDPRTRVRTWKLWQDRVVPSFALEVVSQDWQKDYIEAIDRYAALGVPEVLMFDPEWDGHEGGMRWQVFRRVGKRGLVRVEATNADRVRSRALRCWLRATGEDRDLRLRIAVGPRGDELVPTAEEREEGERAAKEQECAAKEQERIAKEQERAAKEQECAAKEAALARVAELEAELQRLKGRLRRR
jgi:Uma2 family endonuclease